MDQADQDILGYQEPKPTLSAHIIDFFQTVVVFAAIGTAIYLFVAQPHKVSGASMFPNFHDGDYIMTDKVTYRFSQPKRGDIVVFKNPRDKSQDFIKRITGLPGDRVAIESNQVLVNGRSLVEPYTNPATATEPGSFLQDGQEVTVAEDHYLVLGDNRGRSSDSREWGFISKEEIIGRVFFRYWPKETVGLVETKPPITRSVP